MLLKIFYELLCWQISRNVHCFFLCHVFLNLYKFSISITNCRLYDQYVFFYLCYGLYEWAVLKVFLSVHQTRFGLVWFIGVECLILCTYSREAVRAGAWQRGDQRWANQTPGKQRRITWGLLSCDNKFCEPGARWLTNISRHISVSVPWVWFPRNND